MDKRLRSSLERRNLLFIVGTGYSAATTGGATHATWRGLIQNGIERAVALGSKEAWRDQLSGNLAYGFGENDMDMILGSAAGVVRELEKYDPYAYAKWLKETVGSLEVTHGELGKTIRSLPFPVLTTNYDRLLENNDRRTTDWTDSVEMQRVLAGESRSIGHLHGVWNNPKSVILSDRHYDELLRSETAQTLQRAASSLKSIVYVGFGSGLSDPNFAKMIDWHRSHFIPSGVDHFRLCRSSELNELRAEHGADHVIPVAYGDEHDELADFLKQFVAMDAAELSVAGIVRDVVGESQVTFAEDMKTDAILADTFEDIEDRALAQVIIPPVLIPVPHSEYIKARTKKSTLNVERLDPAEEIKSAEVLIIAAEENSGLTTALKWMTLEAAKYLVGAAPIYVPFHACKRSANPVSDQVRSEAIRAQLVSGKKEPLPPHVLGLDNFSPYVEKVSEASMVDIAKSGAMLTIVGCVQGVEDELVDKFKQLGIVARVRYIGKLSAADVRSYAKLVSPTNYEALAEQVLLMLRVENLARTPFTVSLLLSVLIQGGKFSANASQTSILDDYIGLLLGRGDPHDDARFGLDQKAREALLSGLAQSFVEAGVGGLTEIDVQRAFQSSFDKFGWQESTTDVLASFLERRVLRRKGRYIEFSRSSFLHIFAAKRATLDSSFREKLLERPIYYSAAITDYAALYRHDADLLDRLGLLLRKEYATTTQSSVFDPLELAAPRLHSEEPPQAEARETGSGRVSSSSDSEGSKADRMRQWEDEVFDSEDDDDLPPFPTTHEDDVPPAVQLYRTLELVSTVLRDSDQIENLALKQAVLADVLEKWGLSMDVMSEDASFHEYLRSLIVDLEIAKPDEKEEKALLDELGRAIPAAITLGTVGGTLASRKLNLLIERITGDPDAPVSDETIIIACFFRFSLGEPGWPKQVSDLIGRSGNIWIVRNFLLHLFIRAYQEDETKEGDSSDLLELCVSIVQRAISYKDEPERRRHRHEIVEDLTAARLRSRVGRQLTGSQTQE